MTRIVPSRRNFIKDDDNLRFAVKPLNDALKRLRLIHDDAREWLEQPMPTQEVGSEWATVITIESLAGSQAFEQGDNERSNEAGRQTR